MPQILLFSVGLVACVVLISLGLEMEGMDTWLVGLSSGVGWLYWKLKR